MSKVDIEVEFDSERDKDLLKFWDNQPDINSLIVALIKDDLVSIDNQIISRLELSMLYASAKKLGLEVGGSYLKPHMTQSNLEYLMSTETTKQQIEATETSSQHIKIEGFENDVNKFGKAYGIDEGRSIVIHNVNIGTDSQFKPTIKMVIKLLEISKDINGSIKILQELLKD